MTKKNILILLVSAFIVIAIILSVGGLKKSKELETNYSEAEMGHVEITAESYKKEEKVNAFINEEVKTINPAFDVVRVENKKAVFAGRADKNVVVHILSGDKELATIKTDSRGEFVYIPLKEFESGYYEFSLYYEKDGKKYESVQNALLAIDTKSLSGIAVLVGGDDNNSKLLSNIGGEKIGNLVISVVEYDFNKSVFMSGKADAGAVLNVYLNDKFIKQIKADEIGKWSVKYESILVKDKAYKLRVDEADADGKVLHRVENEFTASVVIMDKKYKVVKGDCLWKIARKEYGKGIKYLLIFEANKSQIRDPNLIYPNQIFVLPKSI